MSPAGVFLFLALAGSTPAGAGENEGIAVDVVGSCPSRVQVVAALEARMPGVTAFPGRRLSLEGSAQAPRLALRAADGRMELERPLSLDARGPTPEGCEALAEAAALVVVRYLREIGYRPPVVTEAAPPAVVVAPAAPPAPAPLRAAVASAGYLGVAGSSRLVRGSGGNRAEALVSFAVHRGWLAGELAAGATSETAVPVAGAPGASLRLRSFPVRLAAGTPLALGPGTFVATAGLSADLLTFRATGLEGARSGLRLEPAGELAASYLLDGYGMFARVTTAGGLNLAPRDFDAGLPAPVFRTPSAYLRVQIEVGVRLWKNPGVGRL